MTVPILRFTAARIALFVGCLGLLAVVGVRGAAGLLAAAVLSALLSAVLLKRQRDAIALAAEQRKRDREAARERLRQDGLRDQAP